MNTPHYKRPQCNCVEVLTVDWEQTKPAISNSGLIRNLNMAMSSVAPYFVLICAVCAANAQWHIYAQQYYLQSLNRAVETAKAMYETLAEEKARTQYGYYQCAAANKQQSSMNNNTYNKNQGNSSTYIRNQGNSNTCSRNSHGQLTTKMKNQLTVVSKTLLHL